MACLIFLVINFVPKLFVTDRSSGQSHKKDAIYLYKYHMT